MCVNCCHSAMEVMIKQNLHVTSFHEVKELIPTCCRLIIYIYKIIKWIEKNSRYNRVFFFQPGRIIIWLRLWNYLLPEMYDAVQEEAQTMSLWRDQILFQCATNVVFLLKSVSWNLKSGNQQELIIYFWQQSESQETLVACVFYFNLFFFIFGFF